MIPNTFGSVLIFVVLLLPGYIFLRRRQLDHPARDLSVLDEIASVIFVGVAIDTVVLVSFLALRTVIPGFGPDIDRMLADPGGYARVHYTQLAATLAGLLLVAIGIAYAASTTSVRRRLRRFVPRAERGHQSAWWLLFKEQHPGLDKQVTCLLDDNSLIRGTLLSFSRASREHGDRELILTAPFDYRAPGRDDAVDLPGVAAISISSRRISTLMVSYMERPAPGKTDRESPRQRRVAR